MHCLRQRWVSMTKIIWCSEPWNITTWLCTENIADLCLEEHGIYTPGLIMEASWPSVSQGFSLLLMRIAPISSMSQFPSWVGRWHRCCFSEFFNHVFSCLGEGRLEESNFCQFPSVGDKLTISMNFCSWLTCKAATSFSCRTGVSVMESSVMVILSVGFVLNQWKN